MLDSDPLMPGDLVFDILLGAGTVASVVTGAGFSVDFSGGRNVRYGSNGEFGGAKRVYWRNPVLRVPRKHDAALWDLYRRLIAAVGG